MLLVGLIDIQHMHAVIKGFFFFFFFFKNCYYFSDLEIQWPRNPELKSRDFACLQHLSDGVSHSIEEKNLSSVSELLAPWVRVHHKALNKS